MLKCFIYEALNSKGEYQNGTIEAESSREAIKQIRDMSLFPTKVREVDNKDKSIFSEDKPKITYLEYITNIIGDTLIGWGNKLKEKDN